MVHMSETDVNSGNKGRDLRNPESIFYRVIGPNTEKKLNSRVVKVDECKKVKNYVYRVISEKRYKKLLTLEEIYKFSGIE